MAQLRFKGPIPGDALNVSDVTVGANNGSVNVASFRNPANIDARPWINSTQAEGVTLTLDETGLTGITARSWRIVGGAQQGTGATLDTTGLGGQWIECVVTCDQGTLTSAAYFIYSTGMMASHDADDAAGLALVPHDEVTHVAIADGDWTASATWLGGKVPANGARVLIPHGRAITYDNTTPNIRLDWVRVDGTMTWENGTTLLMGELIVTRGGEITLGTEAGRVPLSDPIDLIVSARNYQDLTVERTTLNLTRDPKLWGRGIIIQGTVRMWGEEVLHGAWATAAITAGATSLTLEEVPVGWTAGSQVIICATGFNIGDPGGTLFQDQSELVTLTSVVGNTITWSGGLTFDHDNQDANSTYIVRPYVALYGGRSIRMTSELGAASEEWEKGHFTIMHHHAVHEINWTQSLHMGRTVKADTGNGAGVIDSGNFKFFDDVVADDIATAALTATSNIKSRYAFHWHHTTKGVATGNFAAHSKGWLQVQHSTFLDMHQCVSYDAHGAGIVAEDGDELGFWDDCVSISCIEPTRTISHYLTGPKTREGARGSANDTFRYGVGFGLRSRGITMVNCKAFGCGVGWSVFTRSNLSANSVGAVSSPKRSLTELKSLNLATGGTTGINNGGDIENNIPHKDHPLLHHTGMVVGGCVMTGQVSKENWLQHHDVQNVIRRGLTFGTANGPYVEYVGNYILEDNLAVSASDGLRIGGNTYGVAAVRNTNEAGGDGVDVQGQTDTAGGTGKHDDFDDTNEPRWSVSDNDNLKASGSAIAYQVPTGATKTGPQVTFTHDTDTDGALDYSADPSETFPLEIGVAHILGSTLTSPDNSDGKKSDSLSANGVLAPEKIQLDKIWHDSLSDLEKIGDAHGFWQYSSDYHLAPSYIITDRLTGRPIKVLKLWLLGDAADDSALSLSEVTTEEPGWTNNGALTYNANAISASDINARCDVGGSVTLNIATLSGASGTGHSSFSLADADGVVEFIGGHAGRVVVDNAATTQVTYTPVPRRGFSDHFYVFLYSEGQYATVRINVLVVDTDSGVTTPVVDTHFAATNSITVNAIDVQLIARPDTSNRFILRTEYSTDGGTTWKRLCNGWHPFKVTISEESDGTAIAPGSYNVRLRYVTDHDSTTSSASADDAVTVS